MASERDRIGAYERVTEILRTLEETAYAQADAAADQAADPRWFAVPGRADEFGDPINPAREAIDAMRLQVAHAIGKAREEIARHQLDFNLNPDRASHSYQD